MRSTRFNKHSSFLVTYFTVVRFPSSANVYAGWLVCQGRPAKNTVWGYPTQPNHDLSAMMNYDACGSMMAHEDCVADFLLANYLLLA